MQPGNKAKKLFGCVLVSVIHRFMRTVGNTIDMRFTQELEVDLLKYCAYCETFEQ